MLPLPVRQHRQQPVGQRSDPRRVRNTSQANKYFRFICLSELVKCIGTDLGLKGIERPVAVGRPDFGRGRHPVQRVRADDAQQSRGRFSAWLPSTSRSGRCASPLAIREGTRAIRRQDRVVAQGEVSLADQFSGVELVRHTGMAVQRAARDGQELALARGQTARPRPSCLQLPSSAAAVP